VRGDLIQRGVWFRSGEQAPPAFRLVLLNAQAGVDGREVGDALGAVLDMLAGLPEGVLPDLPGMRGREAQRSRRQFAKLTTLLGLGARAFDASAHYPPLVAAERPDHLVPLRGFPALPWEAMTSNLAEADVALQLTAERAAAVDIAAAEVAQLLAERGLPLRVVATFGGFGRVDRRGWLGFHDGVSNMQAADRLAALAAPADPPWMAGGTYMAFLRLRVDLAAWRSLPRGEQELLVGREKLSGSALTAVDRSGGVPRPVAGGDFVDPPQSTDPLVEASHVHRANQSRASPHAPGALRIFRQGYEFLEDIGPNGPRLGLNFVSFQRDLGTLQHLLHLPGWLGDANFGGDPGPSFITLLAGGLYAVPPRAEPFAGASLLGSP